MPIRKELQHFYRTPEYRAFRRALLDRSGNACEQCKAPNGVEVYRLDLFAFRGWWWSPSGISHDWQGKIQPYLSAEAFLSVDPETPFRVVRIVITSAHLNHQPGDDRPQENGRALCQACHLKYDQAQHKLTRCIRKDKARPMQWEGSIAV